MGVGALTRSGNVPEFSNRDAIYNDISAPGVGIFSTFPLAMTALHPNVHRSGLLRLRAGPNTPTRKARRLPHRRSPQPQRSSSR